MVTFVISNVLAFRKWCLHFEKRIKV